MNEELKFIFGDDTAVRLLETFGVDPKGVTSLSIHFTPRNLARISIEKLATGADLATVEEAVQTFKVLE